MSTIKQIRPVLTSADLTAEEIEIGLATGYKILDTPPTEDEMEAALFQIDDDQYIRARAASPADFNLGLRYLKRKMQEADSVIANLIIGEQE